jgi:beta-glucosidase/6-phospho-beta-glucosidase/beta-galactosidase
MTCLRSYRMKGDGPNRNIIQYFSDYAELIAHELGDRVKRCLIINEPRCIAWFFQIGIVVDLHAVYPISDDEKDWEAANRLDEFHNGWYIDPILTGEYPPLVGKVGLKPNREDMDLIEQPLDFLGVNYYSRLYAAYNPSDPVTLVKAVQKNTPTTEKGWEIYPIVLCEVLMHLRTDYGNPLLYVTENGGCLRRQRDKGRQGPRRRSNNFPSRQYCCGISSHQGGSET